MEECKGARSITYALREKYSSVSEHQVLRCLQYNKTHGQIHDQFLNKPPLKCISASNIFERVQIDLLMMDSIHVNGKTYKYILSAVDSFSRFLFLRPISSKAAKEVAMVLKGIFYEHGYPDIVQSDNGKEFQGEVKQLMIKNGVKIVKGRPYHPQSQGKVERQNRIVRTKIRYEILRKKRDGFDWVESLTSVERSVNSQPKEVLGYQSPFKVYVARDRQNAGDTIRRKAAHASKRCALRTASMYLKKHPCSIYKHGDQVLLKFPFRKTKVPTKHFVLQGEVLKKGKGYGRYYVSFNNPDGERLCQWVNVEHITSQTREEEKARRAVAARFFDKREMQRQHKLKYYIPLDDDHAHRNVFPDTVRSNTVSGKKKRDYFCGDEGIEIELNPKGAGDCQFKAVGDQLKRIGLHQGSAQLRSAAVEHLLHNRAHYEECVQGKFDSYITLMKKKTTYGDNLTLQALARIFNCQFLVINAQGAGYHCIISNTNTYDKDTTLFTLGYYPEDDGENYVSIKMNEKHIEKVLESVSNFGLYSIEMSDDSIGSENDDHIKDHFFERVSDSKVSDAPIIDVTRRSPASWSCCMSPEEFMETIPFPDIDIDDVQTALNNDIRDLASNESHERFQCKSEESTHPFLPQEILERIIKQSIQMHPLMRYTHQRVNKLFKCVVESVGYPEIHLNPSSVNYTGNPISVACLSRNIGRNSGAMAALKQVLQDAQGKWFRAWLTLRAKEYDWYDIVDVNWR